MGALQAFFSAMKVPSGTYATGQIIFDDNVGTPSEGDTITVGSVTYTFADGNNVGTNVDMSSADGINIATKLALKINADTATTLCTAIRTDQVVDLTANSSGVGGNSIALSTTCSGSELNLVGFSGGS